MRLVIFIALILLAPYPALAQETGQSSLLGFMAVATALIIIVLGLTRWRRDMKAEDAVRESADAAYCIVDLAGGRFTVSSGLAKLLKRDKPLREFADLATVFLAEEMRHLEQAIEHCRQNRPIPVLDMHLGESEGHFECRLFSRADKKGDTVAVVVWFFDVTDRGRQRARLEHENEKLKTELKQYSTIINMAPYPIWQRDPSLKVRYYNLAYSEVVEGDSDHTASETPELDKKVRQLAKAAMESGRPVSERLHIVVGGERKLYHITELPVPQEKILVGFAIDITEVELLREDLSRHVSAQADLLESSASAMAIYGADMRLKSYNYAFVALWKLDEMWLDTQPTYGELLETLRDKRKLPEQANFQLFKQQQIKLFTDLIAPREEFFYLPDGKTLRVIAIPHALGGILFAYEDVTDRLALESSYNTLIAVQRETLDNLHEGLAVFGEDGRLKLYNPGYLKLWHIDADFARSEPHMGEIIERCKPLFSFEDWEKFKQNHIENIQVREYRARQMERSDGKVIDWRKVPLPDGATLITYLDITASTLVERSLRERADALQEADRLKTEFLANVSYELRSPLTSISGFSEMLREEYFGALSDKQKEYVDGIHQSSQHLMQLINDILDLASVEAGFLRLEVNKFDIHAMMKSVLSLIQERSKEHHIKIDFKCPAKIGKMTGDETRLKQSLFNLLSNAIKYSGEGDTVTLGAKEEDDDHILLWVEDEGEGIPEAEREAVFGKFYKGRNQEAAKGKSGQRSGPGLGLSIVKSFIELHGGTVSLKSQPGKGACFQCHLQRHNPELQQYVKPKRAA